MKIKGTAITPPKDSIVEIYRTDEKGGKVIVRFTVSPVLDYAERDAILKQPEPPVTILYPSKEKKKDYKEPKYLLAMSKYIDQCTAWLNLKSLEKSEIEWETVKLDDPETWVNYLDDFRKVLTEAEIVRILQKVQQVNNPTNEAYDEAFSNFTLDPLEESEVA